MTRGKGSHLYNSPAETLQLFSIEMALGEAFDAARQYLERLRGALKVIGSETPETSELITILTRQTERERPKGFQPRGRMSIIDHLNEQYQRAKAASIAAKDRELQAQAEASPRVGLPEAPPAAFDYSRWRHGGWYVHDVRYPTGACGCVSNNYDDRKWRIGCDPRPFEEQPTFRTRDDAAQAEWLLARDQTRAVNAIFARLDSGTLSEAQTLAELPKAVNGFESSAAAMLKDHQAAKAA